jgi:hypothetical protein
MTAAPAHPTARYTQALSKGGALLPETRTLVAAWRPGESGPDFAQRVLRDDLLGRSTARRVLDIVRVFTLRFLQPTDAPARLLRVLAASEAMRQTFTDLVFYYTARLDDLLRDFTTERYWPAVREGRPLLTNQDVRSLMLEGALDGRIGRPWTDELSRDIAGRVMGALTAFGLLAPLKPGRREILPYRPADGTIIYLAHLLHFAGITDASLADQPAWALFGLRPPDVWHRLDALATADWFILQRAGRVARVTWRHRTMEEAVHALAG